MAGGMQAGWEDWLDEQLEELCEMLTGEGEVMTRGKDHKAGRIWATAHLTVDPITIGDIIHEIEANFPEFHSTPTLVERRKR